MTKPVEVFTLAFSRGLASGKSGTIDVVQAVNALANVADLYASLDEYCRRFDPAAVPKKRDTLEFVLSVGRLLFRRALDLATASNGLAEMVQTLPSLATAEPDAKLKSKHHIYAKRFVALRSEDREELQKETARLLKQRAKAGRRRLIDIVAEDYRREKGRAHADADELTSYLRDAPNAREVFAKVATACDAAWTAPSAAGKKRPKTSAAVEALDAAFGAYGKYLETHLVSPTAFFRILVWLRESAVANEQVVKLGRDTYRLTPTTPWSHVWSELYLDTCQRAQRLFVSRAWEVASVVDGQGFVGADMDFVLVPFRAKERQLFRERLANGFRNVPQFAEFHQARRRATIIGALKNLVILDEQERDDLDKEIVAEWKLNAREVASRKFTTRSPREAFKDTFHINETAKGVFTVLWIPKDRRSPFVFIEAHSLPGFYFKANILQVGLADMLEHGAYADLSRNAQALAAFLLAYLQVLSYVLDVVTAGAAAGATGGIRFILLRFAEERLREQALKIGFAITGIDNPWVQTLVGVGVNFVPSAIKAPGLKIPHDVDVPPVAVRPPSGVPNSSERGIDAPLAGPAPVKPAPSPKATPPPIPPPWKPAAPPKAQPATKAVSEAEDVAQQELMILKIDRVANENVQQAQGALAVGMGPRGSSRPPSGVPPTPPKSSGVYVVRRPAKGGSPPREPGVRKPAKLEVEADDLGRSGPANSGQIWDETLTGARGTGKIAAETEAGLFMHQLNKLPNAPHYAEALRPLVGNPEIPRQLEHMFRAGKFMRLGDLPNDLAAEVWLGVLTRADRIEGRHMVGNIIYELKPDSWGSMPGWMKKLDDQVHMMNTAPGSPRNWQGVIVVYDQAEALRLLGL